MRQFALGAFFRFCNLKNCASVNLLDRLKFVCNFGAGPLSRVYSWWPCFICGVVFFPERVELSNSYIFLIHFFDKMQHGFTVLNLRC